MKKTEKLNSTQVGKICILACLVLFSFVFFAGCEAQKDTGKTISKELCDSVQKGMSKQQVLDILGEPDSSSSMGGGFGNSEHVSFRSGNMFTDGKGASHSCSVQLQQDRTGIYRVSMVIYNNM